MTSLKIVLLIFYFTISCCFCSDFEDQWVLVKKSDYTGYQIDSVRKTTDSENQTYIVRINAPKQTEMESSGHFVMEKRTLGWRLVSMNNDGVSALYEADVTTSINNYLIPPLRLMSETESLSLKFNTFVDRDEQVNFKFNRCQVHVRRRDPTGSTTFQLSVRGCICERQFTGSVLTFTSSDFKETSVLSPLYFSISHVRRGDEDQQSTISIDLKALEQDDVKIKSLKFKITVDEGDFNSPLIDVSEYEYNLV